METSFDLFASNFVDHPFVQIGPISEQNEMNVLHMVSEAAKLSLSMFPTQLDEDEKELKSLLLLKDGDWDRINCLRMRIGEKRVLQFYVDLYSSVLKWTQQLKTNPCTNKRLKSFKHFKHSTKPDEKYFYQTFIHEMEKI